MESLSVFLLFSNCMGSTKIGKDMNECIQSNKMLLLNNNEQHCSLIDQDYIERFKQFQIYVSQVKKITRPGCSPEMLDMALTSISSLFETLSAISSKPAILHASL
ncbi:pyrophosphate--fructose 6-phosphate 1-phosphotransferase subunit alpha-like [Andrographis paniculata]|uniref:pyrophosphate--fructose 6-phosphate 1-phosphotransferase subunit alpha-like n=1 Tax=Andrographis paniculata TaxID=175694 RepID=UPI0021E9ABA2|nr:pyrophosphate--fructose 6-phosphate 1-phosphotransferase subunit alpha-like [Andrographis paniculata]